MSDRVPRLIDPESLHCGMHPDLARYYRDDTPAADLLDELAGQFANTDFDWEAILAHSYTTVLPQLFGRFCAVDAGCHLGVHTDQLLRLDGLERVECYEPIPRYARHLRDRFRKEARVRVHEVALAAEAGHRRFVVNESAPGESGLRERSFYNVPDSRLVDIRVRCQRLDDDRYDSLGFLKIDTEGGEIDILRGGEQTVARHRPLVAVEFGIGGFDAYGHQPSALEDVARAHDYVLTDLFFNVCEPGAFSERICNRFYWDYFLLPREHLDDVRTLKRSGAFGS